MKPLYLTSLLAFAVATTGSVMAATCSLEKEVEADWAKRGGAPAEIVFAYADAKGVHLFPFATPVESTPTDKPKFQIPAEIAKKLAGVKEIQVFKRSRTFTGLEPVVVLPYAEKNLDKIKARSDCYSASKDGRIFTEKCSVVDLSGRETLSVVHGRFASLCKEIADAQIKEETSATTSTLEEAQALSKSIKDLEALFGVNREGPNRSPVTLEAPRYATEVPAVQTGSKKKLEKKSATSGKPEAAEKVQAKSAD